MGSTTVQAPPARNIGQETSDTLSSQIALAPDQYAAYAKFAPQYAQTDINTLGQSLFGQDFSGNLSDINRLLTSQANLQSQQSNTAQRTSDVADVANLGPSVMNLLQQTNPDLYRNQAQFEANAFNPFAPGAAQTQAGTMAANGFDTGTNPVLDTLNATANNRDFGALFNKQRDIALQQLDQGGNLSPEELRNVQQASRAGFAARGLGGTNASVVDEVMNTDSAKRQRLLESLGIAGNVYAQGQNTYGLLNQAGAIASGANLQQQQLGLGAQQSQLQALQQQAQLAEQQRQFQSQLQQQSIANRQATFFDPFQGVLGRSSGNIGINQNLFGNAAGVNAPTNQYTANAFNPFNAYASDLYNTNYNADAAARISTANNNAGLFGSTLGAIGTAAGGYLGYLGLAAMAACWVAREVYGVDNPKWMKFREWMLNRAPESLRRDYLAHGPAAAEFIKDKPEMKAQIRAFMDARIAEMA